MTPHELEQTKKYLLEADKNILVEIILYYCPQVFLKKILNTCKNDFKITGIK